MLFLVYLVVISLLCFPMKVEGVDLVQAVGADLFLAVVAHLVLEAVVDLFLEVEAHFGLKIVKFMIAVFTLLFL